MNNQQLYSVINATDSPTLQAFTVSEINTIVSDVLTANMSGTLSVEGEVSNLSNATSGHRYFSLKDSHSTISCALFRGSANRISRNVLNDLKNGDKVLIRASISVYQPRGSYQLIVSDIEPAGFGALAKSFAELKQKLDNAGYTASECKRKIPRWATGVAVVTSSTGAAVKDVISTLARRAPFIPVTVYPTLVQGQTAPTEIVQALANANEDTQASVIVLVRGGGSLEDLQAFNDERVAMAVVNSRLPVVTGVGHETDFTIVDFVSDARAPTPTAAAEWVSPDKNILSENLQKQHQRLHVAIMGCLSHRYQRLNALSNRLSAQHPQRATQLQGQHLDELASRLGNIMSRQASFQRLRLEKAQRQLSFYSPTLKLQTLQNNLNALHVVLVQSIKQHHARASDEQLRRQQRLSQYTKRLTLYQQQLKGLEARLRLLSPLGILNRGYAIAFDESGKALHSVTETVAGDRVRIRLRDGELMTVIQSPPSDS